MRGRPRVLADAFEDVVVLLNANGSAVGTIEELSVLGNGANTREL